MVDIRYIRENVDEVRENLQRRRMHVDLDLLLELDKKRRNLLQEVEGNRAIRNEISEKIPSLQQKERELAIEEVRELKEALSAKEATLQEVQVAFDELLGQIPNLLSPEVPRGESDADNVEVRQVGTIPEFNFEPKDHVALAEQLDMIDFERAAKVAGSKFYFLKNAAVSLELAMTSYALSVLQEEGFSFIKTPLLARKEVLDGAGYNPRGEETQIYSVENSDLALIATSEIPIGGYLQNEVLEEGKLPVLYAGLSECYRTEAGNYGRFSKGLYRVHHFTKIEMFAFTTPDESPLMHERMLSIEEKIWQGLEIPYRVVNICDGDLGAVAYKKYDLEAWMPGRGEKGDWGEVTSCSNCTDYQSRRLNIRFRRPDGSLEHVHTLNGTAIAISRALIALLENHQNSDGSITIPKVLRPYMSAKERILVIEE